MSLLGWILSSALVLGFVVLFWAVLLNWFRVDNTDRE